MCLFNPSIIRLNPNNPGGIIHLRTPITTGVVHVRVFHILTILISKSLLLESFSNTLTILFLSDGTAISIIQHF